MKTVTQETRQKLHNTHVELAKEPGRLEFLRKIAQDPANKEKRAIAMKAKWADPVFKAKMLKQAAERREAKKAEEAQAEADRTTPAEKAAASEKAEVDIIVAVNEAEKTKAIAEVTAVVMDTKKKRPDATEQQKAKRAAARKAKYAATRKAKRAAAKS